MLFTIELFEEKEGGRHLTVTTKVTTKTSQTLAVLFLSRNQVKYCRLGYLNLWYTVCMRSLGVLADSTFIVIEINRKSI